MLPRTQESNCLNKVLRRGCRSVDTFLEQAHNKKDQTCIQAGQLSCLSWGVVRGVGHLCVPFKVVLFASSGIKRYFLCFLSPCVQKKEFTDTKMLVTATAAKKNFRSSIVVKSEWDISVLVQERHLLLSPDTLCWCCKTKTQLWGKKEKKITTCDLLANSDFWSGCYFFGGFFFFAHGGSKIARRDERTWRRYLCA